MIPQVTIHQLFEVCVAKNAQQIAIVYEDSFLTYQQLNEKANALAHKLQELGVKPEVRVAICLQRSPEFLIAVLAILKAGGAYVPLDRSNPPERVHFILEDNQFPILITETKEESFRSYPGKLLVLQEMKWESYPRHNLSYKGKSTDLAYVIYTSGSTGKPKGVLIEHHSVVNYRNWFAMECFKEFLRVDFSSNPAFDIAVTVSLVPLLLGLTVVICPDEVKKDVRRYLDYLKNQSIQFTKLTPSYFKLLLHEVSERPAPLSALHILFGGEPLFISDCEAWLERYANHMLYNEYGPTEATVAVTLYPVSLSQLTNVEGSVPIGKPGPNMICAILDESLRPVSPGEIGELYIGGECLARGYLNQPELTQHRFVAVNQTRFYKTGDLCRELSDGNLQYIERIDDQVKIRGYRVEPREIELTLCKHIAIKEAIVLAKEDRHGEKKLIGYFIVHQGHKVPHPRQIRQFLKTCLPEYMIPASCVNILTLPLTENGKLDRAALPLPENVNHSTLPSSSLETELAKLWEDELELRHIGADDHFFELGGHSLAAARVLARIASQYNKEISIADFYKLPTIKNLANLTLSAPRITTRDEVLAETAPLPLSDFQLMLWLSRTFEPKARHLNLVVRKRIRQTLRKDTLNLAFAALCRKHEIFSYNISSMRPVQKLKEKQPVAWSEKNLKPLSSNEVEKTLECSALELIEYYHWKSQKFLLAARLFHIADELDELQLVIPHILIDKVSLQILWVDLLYFYELFQNNPAFSLQHILIDQSYKKYLIEEQKNLTIHLRQSCLFWKTYLQDTSLLFFAEECIVKKILKQGLAYTHYAEIPQQALSNLQLFCAEKRVSLSEGLCAAVGLALRSLHVSQSGHPVFINMVKSTRNQPEYDETIGCYLKLDAIKLHLSNNDSLSDLTAQVHHALLATAPYQNCPGLIKLASIGSLTKKKSFKLRLVQWTMKTYAKLAHLSTLQREVFHYCARLNRFKRSNQFLLTLNIHHNFIAGDRYEQRRQVNLSEHESVFRPYDLLKIDSCLDICFLRDESNKPYIAISANLLPKVREKLAQKIIHSLLNETMRVNANEVA